MQDFMIFRHFVTPSPSSTSQVSRIEPDPKPNAQPTPS
jgi:hypothetical protein